MAFGLEVYDTNGVKTISITDTMYLVLFTVIAPVLTSGSATVLGVDPNTCRAIVHPYAEAQVLIPHIVTLTANTVTWVSGSSTWGCGSLIMVVTSA